MQAEQEYQRYHSAQPIYAPPAQFQKSKQVYLPFWAVSGTASVHAISAQASDSNPPSGHGQLWQHGLPGRELTTLAPRLMRVCRLGIPELAAPLTLPHVPGRAKRTWSGAPTPSTALGSACTQQSRWAAPLPVRGGTGLVPAHFPAAFATFCAATVTAILVTMRRNLMLPPTGPAVCRLQVRPSRH